MSFGSSTPVEVAIQGPDLTANRAGQYGLSVADVARSLVTATSSSRFVAPNF